MVTSILALDPGTKNFGFSILRVEEGTAKILRMGLLHKTLIALNTDVVTQVAEFSSAIEELIDEHKVTHLIAERYMSRRMGGTTIECINAMLGILMGIARQKKVSIKFIPASQWKNAMGRLHPEGLVGVYQSVKEVKITDHTVDSVFIGVYARDVLEGTKPFAELEIPRLVRFMKRIGAEDIGERKKPVKKKRKIRR